jgi:hypothetical protein
MEPKTLEDFATIVELSTASELFLILASDQFHAGHWVFRGQARATWLLEPSLERFARSIHDRELSAGLRNESGPTYFWEK